MKMRKMNKKGFSLVEVVIAMAVVSIVTLTAISIVYSATDINRAGNAESDAIYFAADAVECFKATNTEEGFWNALEFRDGSTCNRTNSTVAINHKWDARIEYTIDDSYGIARYTITIIITEKGTNRPLMNNPITYKKAE